jgi:lysophospholipase L1-like esterase
MNRRLSPCLLLLFTVSALALPPIFQRRLNAPAKKLVAVTTIAFNPSTVGTFVFGFESGTPGTMFQNSTCVTPCTTDGDALMGWTGPLSSKAANGTAGAKYIYRTNGPNGLPYLDGSGNASYLIISNSTPLARYYAVMRTSPGYYAFGGNSAVVGAHSGTAYPGLLQGGAPRFLSGGVNGVLGLSKNFVVTTSGIIVDPTADWFVVSVDCNNPLTNQLFRVGSDVNQAPTRFDLAAVIGYSDLPSTSDDALIYNYLSTKYLRPTIAASGLPAGIETSGLQWYVSASSGVYSNILRTGSISSGDNVIVLKDLTGKNHDFIKGNTTVATPWLSSGFTTNKPSLLLNGGYLAASRALELEPTGSVTILMAFSPTNYTSGAYNEILTKNNTAEKYCFIYKDGNFFRLGSSLSSKTYGSMIAVYRYDASTNYESVWINGLKCSDLSATLTTTSSKFPWKLGHYGDDTLTCGAFFQAMALYNRALTDAEIRTLTSLHSTNCSTGIRIICDGNSITLGTGATGVNNYEYNIATNLAGNHFLINRGVGGRSWVTQITDTTNMVDGLYQPGETNVIVAFEGTNLGGGSTNNLWQQASNYCTLQRSKGFKVLIGTTLPAIAFTNNGVTFGESARLESNQLIRDYWTNFADGLVDFGTNILIGQTYCNTNTTYYADGTHPTTTGYNIIGQMISNSLRSFLGMP